LRKYENYGKNKNLPQHRSRVLEDEKITLPLCYSNIWYTR